MEEEQRRREDLNVKLSLLKYPDLNPEDPIDLVENLVEDLLAASEGYQIVKLKMREMQKELEDNLTVKKLNKSIDLLQKENRELKCLVIEKEKILANRNQPKIWWSGERNKESKNEIEKFNSEPQIKKWDDREVEILRSEKKKLIEKTSI